MKILLVGICSSLAILFGVLMAREFSPASQVYAQSRPINVPNQVNFTPIPNQHSNVDSTQTTSATAVPSPQPRVDTPKEQKKTEVSQINEDKLKKLAELLGSPLTVPNDAGKIIQQLGKDGYGNEEIARFIIKYFEAPVDWTLYPGGPSTMNRLMSRLSGLAALARGRTETGKAYLLSMMDDAALRKATNAWLPSMPILGDGSEPQTAEIKGAAAYSLSAYGDDPQIRSLIENMFYSEKQRVISEGRIGGAIFNHLGDAMARMDLLDRNGLDREFELEENVQAFLNAELIIFREKNYSIILPHLINQ